MLTAGGADQIRRAGHSLAGSGPTPSLIVSSPLARAAESAQILSRVLGVELAEPNPVFAEWRPPDCVLGLTAAQYPAAYRAWRQRRATETHTSLAGGESLSAFAERAAMALELALNLRDEHGPLVVVSHKLLIGAVRALIGGTPEPAEMFDDARGCQIPPAGYWVQTADHSLDVTGGVR